MTELEYLQLKDIPYHRVIELFTNHYIYENSERKLHDIIGKLKNSQAVNKFLINNRTVWKVPEPLELMKFVNSLPFFLFSSTETVCLAGMTLAIARFSEIENEHDLKNETVVGYFLDIILICQKVKLKKADSFYTRLFDILIAESVLIRRFGEKDVM